MRQFIRRDFLLDAGFREVERGKFQRQMDGIVIAEVIISAVGEVLSSFGVPIAPNGYIYLFLR